jgi:acyl-CoA synthetase (NDP forming)
MVHLSSTDLRKFFNPESIAFIGVSRSSPRFGGLSFMRKYLESGYPGRLYPVNPKADEIMGVKAWPGLSALPEVPDLAMVAVAAPLVAEVLEACGQVGLRHVHILTSGFGELGTEEGRALEAGLVNVARRHGMLLIGPNCMGSYRPASGLTAWGAMPGRPGPLGIISQSGGMTQRLTEYADSLGLGVEKAVSVGNGTVLDAMDFLEAFGRDESIRTIGMYLESAQDGRRFLDAARQVGRKKPIVLLRGGETGPGARTAASHTGAMAGDRVLFESAGRQANVTRVRTLDEWVDALLAFSFVSRPSSNSVFVIGGGGGNSVVYGDTCVREGLEVPPLSMPSMDRLCEIVPKAGSIAGNPLDLWETFTNTAALIEIIDLAEADPAVSVVLVDRLISRKAYHMPDGADPTPEIISELKGRNGQKPVVFVVDGEGGDPELAAKAASVRSALGAGGHAAFPTMARAARALARVCRYHERLSSRNHAAGPDASNSVSA